MCTYSDIWCNTHIIKNIDTFNHRKTVHGHLYLDISYNNAGIFSPARAEHEYYTLHANYAALLPAQRLNIDVSRAIA